MEKRIGLGMIAAAAGYLLFSELQLAQHYVVINRDYVPVMSYFYGVALEDLAHFAEHCTAIWLGVQTITASRKAVLYA